MYSMWIGDRSGWRKHVEGPLLISVMETVVLVMNRVYPEYDAAHLHLMVKSPSDKIIFHTCYGGDGEWHDMEIENIMQEKLKNMDDFPWND